MQALAAEYSLVARNAKRGSEVQVAAFKLEQRALRELADTHGVYSRHLQSSTRDMERFGKGALIGSGALGHLGRTAAIASGSFLGGLGLIQVFRSATEGGAALETQMQRTARVFGSSAGQIVEWSKDSVKSLALARAETLNYAASIGTLLQNMGLTESASAQMSKVLLQRAADVAAFKGVATGDVASAFNAGLQGRTRALKQYGIVLDATMIKQEAERLGLVKNTVDLGKVADAQNQVRIAEYNLGKQIEKHGAQSAEAAKATIQLHNAERQLEKAHRGHAEALTADQRAQATYNAILEQTGKQQGWIAGHTNTLAVQERILKAEEKELFEILGTGLIPMLIKYLPHLTEWIDKNEKNGTFARDFNEAIKVGEQVVGAVVPVVKEAAHVWGELAGALGGNAHAIELLIGLYTGKKLFNGLDAIGFSAKRSAGEVSGLTRNLKLLGAIGAGTVAIEIIQKAHTTQTGLHRYSGLGGWANLAHDLTGGWIPESSAGKPPPVVKKTQTNIVGVTGPGSETLNWSGDYGGLDGSFKSKLEQAVVAAGGSAINVTSGRRSPSHNSAVGGAHNSNHLTGHAADGACMIDGHWYPLGDAPLAYRKFGLRAGRSFDWNGSPDTYHVDDGANVGRAGDTTGDGTGDTGGKFHEKPPKPKVLTGTALLSQGLQLALAKAHGTPGTVDDLTYLKQARVELGKLQDDYKAAHHGAESLPIARELANVNRQITAIDTANLRSKLAEVAKAHRAAVAAAKAAFSAEKDAWRRHVQDLQAAADAAKQVFESHWQTAADRTLSAFDDITSRQLTAMGKATSAQLSKMQTDAAKAIQALKVTVSGAGFASFLFGGPGAQTPTELLLAQRSAAKQKADDITSIADATKALADAQAALANYGGGSAGTPGHDAIYGPGGDSVTGIGTAGSSDLASLQKAVADAQKALDDAKYQQETDDLSNLAQLERDAADKQLSDAQQAYQDRADLDQQAYQDRQDAAQQAYQDQRTLERQNISDWLAFQEVGLEAGTIQWTAFYAQLVALSGAYGLQVGAAFWGAWQDAQNTGGAAANAAAAAATGKAAIPYLGVAPAVASGIDPAIALAMARHAIGGYASGGWAGSAPPARINSGDTIPALLRRGEYVMNEDEVRAGGPSWSQGGNGGGVGDVYLDGNKVGVHIARHVTNQQERQIGMSNPRG